MQREIEETTMAPTVNRRTKAAHGRRSGVKHPHGVAILSDDEGGETPDQPFVEGAQDTLDPDLRHRMVSEAAYHRYAERGFEDGYELDDWLQAESDVEQILLNRTGS